LKRSKASGGGRGPAQWVDTEAAVLRLPPSCGAGKPLLGRRFTLGFCNTHTKIAADLLPVTTHCFLLGSVRVEIAIGLVYLRR